MQQNRFCGLQRETMTDALIASALPLFPVINSVNKGEVLKALVCVSQRGDVERAS